MFYRYEYYMSISHMALIVAMAHQLILFYWAKSVTYFAVGILLDFHFHVIVPNHIYQPLRSSRIWHKVNF